MAQSIWLFAILSHLTSLAACISVTSTRYWNITNDPQGSARLNGLAFQQHALATFNDHQYVAVYSTSPKGYGNHYVNLGRRRVSPTVGEWQYFAFTDYEQKTLDEHNTISMGISGDGKIHLSFDHHDVPLNYRASTTGIATTLPSSWTQSTFGGTIMHSLPGSTGPWTPLTYPRFERLPNGDMLMEFRIGKSGAGDSYMHRYSSSTGQWSPVGKYLQGQDNNAYINGLTATPGPEGHTVFVSWTVRETPDASTNHDFYFAYTDDDGRTWRASSGQPVAKPIVPTTPGVKVYSIPQNSEIMNQEAQCADDEGRFHALMRDRSAGGPARFYHYLRTPGSSGAFSKRAINVGISTPPYLSYRGKIAAWGDNVLAILPDAPKSTVTVWAATAGQDYRDWELLGTIANMAGEPGVDYERLERRGVLSLFVRQGGAFGERKVQVWDFVLAA
ncbi:uncharacterized protein EI97DRAFT_460352 [Westerdykella ornata]|uniref:Dockerin type 1 n=1 Tax=Westerdykella ornata TaxID=318751 RepID=A0A6A6JD79_WESOR|nr:uncharacterized protein EI97DRAFT_460352 [Westerdykella ornata]KAF2274227.1 hypothetical protein EI97DRAFT_460352 [Westerdykella ornata]